MTLNVHRHRFVANTDKMCVLWKKFWGWSVTNPPPPRVLVPGPAPVRFLGQRRRLRAPATSALDLESGALAKFWIPRPGTPGKKRHHKLPECRWVSRQTAYTEARPNTIRLHRHQWECIPVPCGRSKEEIPDSTLHRKQAHEVQPEASQRPCSLSRAHARTVTALL